MARFAALETELFAEIDAMSGRAGSEMLARFAAEKRDEVIRAAAPHEPQVAHYVDGKAGAALATVQPHGTIRFEFNYLDEVAKFIFETLVARSPYRGKQTGAKPPTHYRDEHRMFLDGLEIAAIPEPIPPGAELVFANMQPYSRKIERGFSAQAPSGVYEAVARLARSRFGNTADITFTYRDFPGQGPMGPSYRKGTKSGRAADDRFPAILVRSR